MLIEKDVWDLIETGPRPQQPNTSTLFDHKVKEDRIAIGTAGRIIREGLSDDIFNNIIDIDDPQAMWAKLQSVCSHVGQGVVYSILQELFNYSKVNKPKEYEKTITSIFADVRLLTKRLRAALTLNRDIYDSIAIVIALDSIHDDFETKTSSLLETGDKTIDEIQQILCSAEAKNLSKRATGVTNDLAMSFRGPPRGYNERYNDRYNDNYSPGGGKRKAYSDERCFNCHKLGHYGRDCTLPDRRGPQPERSNTPRNNSRPPKRAHQVTAQDDDSEPEPFTPGPVAKAMMVTESPSMEKATGMWYLDSCASRHLCNDKTLFKDLRPMSINFVTAAGQVIRTEQVGTVSIPLKTGRIDLQNVALASECDSNLISLSQLRESGITFHDNPTSMALMKDGKIIAHAKRSRNLFILELAIPGKVMQVSNAINTPSQTNRSMAMRGRGRATHLVRKNRRIRIWHRRLGHASNARVIRAASLVDGIDIHGAKYDPIEVFVDSA